MNQRIKKSYKLNIINKRMEYTLKKAISVKFETSKHNKKLEVTNKRVYEISRRKNVNYYR